MDTVGIWATMLSSSVVTLFLMLGVTTNDTLGGGWTEQTPLTNHDHVNAISLSESIELMARGLRATCLDHGLKSGDETAEQSLLAGLNLIAHAAHTLGDYVEQCQNELERARE